MKSGLTTVVIFGLFAVAGGACGKKAIVQSHFPSAFTSREAANEYVRHLFAGGRLEEIHVGQKEVLVVHEYGSGLPMIGVAAYLRSGDQWKLVSDFVAGGELYTTNVSGKKVFLIGQRTKESKLLLDVE
jgi:hypothetical protein